MPRKCKVLPFPIERARKPAPKTVTLDFDFGFWCTLERVGEKRVRRQHFANLNEARVALLHLVESGLEELPPSATAVAAGCEA